MPTCGRPPSSSGTSRGHLGRPGGAFERITVPAKVRKFLRAGLPAWSRPSEPPIGIEPMTYALREARSRAARTLAAPIARIIALTALAALGLSEDPVHEPV